MFIDETEFDGNDARCPLVLLLDTSASMGVSRMGPSGEQLPLAIDELNSGIQALRRELQNDAVAERRVDVQLVTFGGSVRVRDTWQLASEWQPPTLEASGGTPMGAAIMTGLRLAKERRKELAERGIATYKSWVLLLTDGDATDDVSQIPTAISDANRSPIIFDHVLFWPVAARGANVEALRAFDSGQPVLGLDDTNWSSLFKWVSQAMVSVSKSQPGDQLAIPAWTLTL